MAFDSINFFLFFSPFFFCYWFLFNRNLRAQNLLILLGSYLFYGFISWKFLLLLICISLFNFILAHYIDKARSEKKKEYLAFLAIFQCVGTLIAFKYLNFFISSIRELFLVFGLDLNVNTLNIILPIGISFYTFKIIAYIIDIKNEKIKPVRDWLIFFNYTSFFPTLLAGPIDKPNSLISQLSTKRTFDGTKAKDGMRQILWGLFKKIVIANNCGMYVDQIFKDYESYHWSYLLLAMFLYVIQLYSDFSGYSDIAIGTSRLLGFDIARNFNYPLFAKNIADFWRRWHISLTSWMTEYVYMPLTFVFRKYKKNGVILAIIINFTLVGLWHGSNWKFPLFGVIQGCLFIPLIWNDKLGKPRTKSKISNTVNTVFTFLLIMLTFVLLRSEDTVSAINFYRHLFSLVSVPGPKIGVSSLLIMLFFIAMMLIIEWLNKTQLHGLSLKKVHQYYFRWMIYVSLIILIGIYGGFSDEKFIYLKF
jgi:alginate O-acetyltransferase complex protein AlgI